MVLTRPEQLRIDLPLEAIAGVCQKHGVSELAVFGSVLRDDFEPARSDVDFLVRFKGNDAGPWMSKFLDMKDELGALLGGDVDVVRRPLVKLVEFVETTSALMRMKVRGLSERCIHAVERISLCAQDPSHPSPPASSATIWPSAARRSPCCA